MICCISVTFLLSIVLERVLKPRKRLFCSSLWSVVITLSFLLCLPPLGRLVAQAGMIPAKDTPTIKSVKVLTLGC